MGADAGGAGVGLSGDRLMEPDFILVRCACGGRLLVPNTRTWRFARWVGDRPDVVWFVPALVIIWFLIGSGMVRHARQ